MGHHVGTLSCDGLGLTRLTRACRSWHRVPQFGADPLGWLDAALDIAVEHGYEVLFPTQEPLTVLAAFPNRLASARVATAVPSFSSLLGVQDKLAAHATLSRLGLPQPETVIVEEPRQAAAWNRFPIYLKTPVGTATSGVYHVADRDAVGALLRSGALDEGFADGGVLTQAPVEGPIVMAQTVFDRGRLVAFHANLRTRLGVRGGASHKRSVEEPDGRRIMEQLGRSLAWHGALSADLVLTPAGPLVIDINPRLVEPGNAYRSGTDLSRSLLDLAAGSSVPALPAGQPDVATHQLLLAMVGAAEQGRGRLGATRELLDGLLKRGTYRGSAEELTPWRHDLRTIAPVAMAAIALAVRPASWQWFSSGSVANYALSPTAWRTIRQHAEHLPVGLGGGSPPGLG
jgi:biotin carboxylase